MKRYSEKRQAILECLMKTNTHPTAAWIYEQLKPRYPSLSFATVYRGLASLKEDGEIRSVGIVKGQERYDATVSPHTHAVCVVCGKVIDVVGVTVSDEISRKVEELTGYTVEKTELKLSGICEECRNKQK